jgi:futalosine hydrolase
MAIETQNKKENRTLGRQGNAGVAILASVPGEAQLFEGLLKVAGKKPSGGPLFYSGLIGENRVILVISGIGKTNAAHAATILLEKYSPSCVINFGVGGAYPSSGLKVGEIAVAEKEIYADEGVLLEDGLRSLEITGIPVLKTGSRKYFNEFPADERLAVLASDAAREISNCRSGTFLTVSACTGTDKRAAELSAKFDPVCENMEGAAVAHVCLLYGVSFVEMRGISNIAENRDMRKWDIRLAAENCQKAVRNFIHSYNRLEDHAGRT